MRHYSLTDIFYFSEVENQVIAATDQSKTVEMVPVTKKLFLRNDGPNDVFIAFGKDKATTNDFKLASTDGLVPIKVQCDKLSLICATGETASVRITNNY